MNAPRPGSRFLSVGDAVVDITATIPALPERGGDVLASESGVVVGGAGFNVLVAAHRLGLTAVYGGAHGTGPFGDLARAALDREGIEILLTAVQDADTGWDVALTDAGSERTFVTAAGAEGRLTTDRIAQVRPVAGDAVHVSGYGLLAEPNRGAITGWLAGLPPEVVVVTDPGPLVGDIEEGTLHAVRSRTTWWSCNLTEARTSTGEMEAEAACRGLAASGMGVIVRLGAAGCLVQEPGNNPVPVGGFAVDAVDSNGAGDAHVGAFIAGVLAGLEPVEAARRANAAAAISVTRRGPATSPTTANLDAFLGRPTPLTPARPQQPFQD